MCLDIITSNNVRNSGVGYKVFYISPTKWKPEFEFQRYNGSTFVPTRKWLVSNCGYKIVSDDKLYSPYFHIITNKRDAKKWLCGDDSSLAIYKVKYRGATVRGRQNNCNIVVAKEMYVIGKL